MVGTDPLVCAAGAGRVLFVGCVTREEAGKLVTGGDNGSFCLEAFVFVLKGDTVGGGPSVALIALLIGIANLGSISLQTPSAD